MAASLLGAPLVARARASWSRRVPNDVSRRAQSRPGRRAGHFPGHCSHSTCTAARRSSGDRRAAPRPRRRRDPPLRRRRGRRRATSSSRAYGACGRHARAGALGAAPTPWWLVGDGPGPWTTPRRDPGGLGRRPLTRAAWARPEHAHARLRRAAPAPDLARRGPRPAGAAWARSLCCVCQCQVGKCNSNLKKWQLPLKRLPADTIGKSPAGSCREFRKGSKEPRTVARRRPGIAKLPFC